MEISLCSKHTKVLLSVPGTPLTPCMLTPTRSEFVLTRLAALKCRQRKKQWLNELQTKVEQLQMENDRLNQTVAGLHDEIGRLSGVLMQHRDCGLGLPAAYGRPLR